MSMIRYLCYDIKGIQRFIYSVPRLKSMIGASGLIYGFDREAQEPRFEGAECVFSGGGRGAFRCDDESIARHVRDQLLKRAHESGFDIRFGMDASLSVAAQNADELYPYCPESLAGEPCEMSGLWPVPPDQKEKVHPLIRQRLRASQRDELGTRILKALYEGERPRSLHGFELRFLRNVNPEPEQDDGEVRYNETADVARARAAQAALGSRNRWAVVTMDGNDMGKQSRAAQERFSRKGDDDSEFAEWFRTMSGTLSDITRESFLRALRHAIEAWLEREAEFLRRFLCDDEQGRTVLLLPFRPLILGGDDIVMLCHSEHAMPFVETMASEFARLSREKARQYPAGWLWPATGGELSISAGILYCKTTFPLHLAIPYAESLLSGAKADCRSLAKLGQWPTPAAVDWDVITDTLVDTPGERRRRDLQFKDLELGGKEIRLTRRPYLLGEKQGELPSLRELYELAQELVGLPTSIQARLLPSLQKPWSGRMEFLISVAKRHRALRDLLWESEGQVGAAWHDSDDRRATGVPDALLVLEESRRMIRPTVD